jgi:hypothetical protein
VYSRFIMIIIFIFYTFFTPLARTGQPVGCQSNHPSPQSTCETSYDSYALAPCFGSLQQQVFIEAPLGLNMYHSYTYVQVAQAREGYARRLCEAEADAAQAHALVQDTLTACSHLFDCLVERTARLLAGRVPCYTGNAALPGNGALPLPPPHAPLPAQSTGSSQQQQQHFQVLQGLQQLQVQHGAQRATPTPVGRAAVAAAAAGQDKLAMLLAMNDRLASENGVLLGELARFHCGQHPMLRRNSLAVLGATTTTTTPPRRASYSGSLANDPLQTSASCSPAAATTDNNSQAVRGGGNEGGAAADRIAAAVAADLRRTLSGLAFVSPGRGRQPQARSRRHSVSQCGSEGTGGDTAVGAATTLGAGQQQCSQHRSAAAVALAAAVKEALLCGKAQLLPGVLRDEGWEAAGGGEGSRAAQQQQPPSGAALHGAAMRAQLASKAEAAVGAAEGLIAAQARELRLQREVVALRLQLTTAAGAAEASRAAAAAAAEALSACQRRVEELEAQLRNARCVDGGSSAAGGGCGAAAADVDAARFEGEAAVRAARAEAQVWVWGGAVMMCCGCSCMVLCLRGWDGRGWHACLGCYGGRSPPRMTCLVSVRGNLVLAHWLLGPLRACAHL